MSKLVQQILFLAFLILLNGFFSMSEMAIVSCNRFKMQHLADKGNNTAKKVLRLLDAPSNFLAAIQVGITFAGFFSAGQATKSFETVLSTQFQNIGFLKPYADVLPFLLITLIMSYFTLVFGELLPKRIALQKSDAIALKVAGPILTMMKIVKPFVKLLSGSTTLFAKIFGVHSDTIEEEISISEIRSKIEEGKERGVINQTERDMLDGIFEFDNRLAREVMTPRTDVVMIDITDSPRQVIEEVTNGRYSRLPVYEGDSDNIIGILVIKDLYREFINKGEVKDLRRILRKVLYAPETKHIDDLFKQMQATNNHIAILIDEYGGFSGIVTIEDLLEEIVGNIFDEHDITFTEINKIDDGVYIVDGMVTVDQINDDINVELDTENADTIGGYFIEKLGHVPQKGDFLEDEELSMEVLRIHGKRIKDLKIIKKDQPRQEGINEAE